jgi:hypothetical protein
MNGVLVVESDPPALSALIREFTAAGVPAVGVTSIAHVERWPAGLVVITDLPHFTPWWREVGATQVIVFVVRAEDALPAMRGGATGWLVRADGAVGIAALGLTPA